jgi:hypothetical protein
MLGGDSSKPYVIFAEAFRMKKDHRTAAHFYKLANSLKAPDSSCESDKQLLTFHKGP